MNQNITDMFIEDIYKIAQATYDEKTIKQVKMCLIDYLGVTIAGAKELKNKHKKYITLHGGQAGGVSVIGLNQKINLETAAFLNGMSAHVLELDDGIRYGALHPGAPIISALLAISELKRIKSDKFIAGVVSGYEASIRLAYAMQPSHYNRGYHPTATCGSVGSAVAVGVALGFSKEQLKSTFSAALVSAGGSLKVLEGKSELKPLNSGRAAQVGLNSALITYAGLTGPDNALEGRSGFLSMMSDHWDIDRLFPEENEMLGINKVYYKPYAACRHCHASIEAAFKFKNNEYLNVADIKEIHIKTYEYVIGKHDHKKVNNISSAKMSIPFSFALALIKGSANSNDFSKEMIIDPKINEIMNKVKVIGNEQISKQVPEKRPVIIEVVTLNNDRFVEEVIYPKGEPENPMTYDELINKYNFLYSLISYERLNAEKVVDVILNLEDRLDELYKYI